ncbi:MAG TPA: lasso peptide biosynthesis B2 protein [Polyangiaceae bacterium]|nr:lasso peptide biosynthesis B2 protein [Polyangiaceae bacterium]
MVATRVLHLVARASVRLLAPRTAHRVVRAVGRALPALDASDVARVAAGLAGRGTCLSRALTLAARLPGAEVVIGARRPGLDGAFTAHAWLERDGAPLASDAEGHRELARLRF